MLGLTRRRCWMPSSEPFYLPTHHTSCQYCATHRKRSLSPRAVQSRQTCYARFWYGLSAYALSVRYADCVPQHSIKELGKMNIVLTCQGNILLIVQVLRLRGVRSRDGRTCDQVATTRMKCTRSCERLAGMVLSFSPLLSLTTMSCARISLASLLDGARGSGERNCEREK